MHCFETYRGWDYTDKNFREIFTFIFKNNIQAKLFYGIVWIITHGCDSWNAYYNPEYRAVSIIPQIPSFYPFVVTISPHP